MILSKKGIPVEKGSVGDFTVYERNGKIIVRPRRNSKGHGIRTPGRLEQQSRFLNVTSCWSAFGGTLKGNFELKKPGQTDYNAFQANNLPNARVFLTHEEAAAGASVADNFVISRGTLEPSVQVREMGDWLVSDIYVGDKEITLDTPLYELTGGIVYNNNRFFRDEDEILFYRTYQGYKPVGRTGEVPSMTVSFARVPLSGSDLLTLRQLFPRMRPEDQYLEGFRLVDGYLACRRMEDSLVAWVHRRRVDGKRFMVSTQTLFGTNTYLDDYANVVAMSRAVMSYKPNTKPPLGSKTPKVINPFELPEDEVYIDVIQVPGTDCHNHGRVEGGGYYAKGTRVELRAIPDEGYRFDHWMDGDCTPTRTILATDSRTYAAIFCKI